MAWQAGEPDVDAMLDRITPQQFDEWVAFFIVEPDVWTRQREILKRGFAAMAWGKVEPDAFDPSAESNVIADMGSEASPEQAAAMLRMAAKGAERTRA